MNSYISLLGDMFEWEDGNPNNEDRAGWTVSVNSDSLIRRAGYKEPVLGVVAGTAESVALLANTWSDEWHGKHVRDWAGRVQYEDQTLVTWIRDGRRETYETDRIPSGIIIPDDAEYWTHWPETKEKLFRPQLNPRFLDGSQQNHREHSAVNGRYQGRLERREWAIVVIKGKALVLDSQEVDDRWIPLNKMSKGRLWFIR